MFQNEPYPVFQNDPGPLGEGRSWRDAGDPEWDKKHRLNMQCDSLYDSLCDCFCDGLYDSLCDSTYDSLGDHMYIYIYI